MTPEQLLEKITKTPCRDSCLTDDQKRKVIEDSFTDILHALGLDLKDDSLKETPRRLAKMYVNELFAGLDPKNFPKMTTIENKMGVDQMVTVKNIKVMSVCEHHFVTIHGMATVAYIPKDKIIGLSKLNRIVDYFSRRPQVQERLTKQVADCLVLVLGTENVAVHIDAKHYCVIARGVQDQNSSTITVDLRGEFREPEVREEFLRSVGKAG